MLSREDALNLVKASIKRKNIFYHVLAVEAIARAIARHLDQDEDLWGLAGLLHDLDFDETMMKPEIHGLVAAERLRGLVSEEIIRAIKAHNYEHTGIKPETALEKALIASDAISGLIVACALVMPQKKLAQVSPKTIMQKFKDKDFARGADRNRMLLCEEIGIPRDNFFKIALDALQKISGEIGL
ncbi:MAG: HD domain-containing protein [Candidatus Bathyarchaeia archaeon]